MKISLNALKQYVDIKVSTPELLQLIGSRLVEIEGTESLAEKYVGIKIVKVVSCEKIPETHLSLCQIFDGEKNVQVVCGAPNVHAGMLAAWIMPGAIVPSTFGNENFRLSVRKLRGFESNGMLAAADELGFEGADHDGIIEIRPKDAAPGDNFADVFDLNDIILDIENKSLTHRPDCFGLVGFAREIAGILGEKFTEPAYLSENVVKFTTFLPKITITDPKICPRYSCAVLDIDPDYLSSDKYFTKDDVFLYKSGMRPVSKIVDLTNILMLKTGQPLHAFDYDKFVAVGGKNEPEIIVRLAQSGEKMQLLDDKTVDLCPTDILITSNNTPVALAGAMGGKNTAIDISTKKIILESATFSLYNLRKTQMAHGIFSEAITRFTKGQPAGQTVDVLLEAVKALGGSKEAICDCYPAKESKNVVKITTQFINSVLGTKYTTEQVKKCLENVSFEVEATESSLVVTAPFWRTDIHIKEDIVEEVGRLLGYDNIPLRVPNRPFIESEVDPIFAFKTKLRDFLSAKLGANEVLTYSFVSKDLQSKVLENPDDSYQIINSISPELQCFRQSLVPSLLDKIRENERAGFTDFSLYEINQISKKSLGLTDEHVPEMETHLALVSLGDYYSAKNLLEQLFRFLGISGYEFLPLETKTTLFEPLHSASVSLGDQPLATLGEVRSSVLKKFKLASKISAFELNLETLLNAPKTKSSSFALSKFPPVSRDLTVKVPQNLDFVAVKSAILSVLEEKGLIFTLAPTSIYRPDSAPHKNLSFHLSFSSPKKTLDSAEISAIIETIVKKLSDDFHAEIV